MSSREHPIVAECYFNLTVEERAGLVKETLKIRLHNVYRQYFGLMTLPFSLFGLIVSIIFAISVSYAIKRRRASRKCYVLLLNRSLGDIVTCLVYLVCSCYIMTTSEVRKNVVQVFEAFISGAFWCGMISYVSLSLLKLVAVARPFQYRTLVTMKRCIRIIVISWFAFVLIVFYQLIPYALAMIPSLSSWTPCKTGKCLRFIHQTRNWFIVIVYFITIVVFLLTVVIIKRSQKFVDSFKKNRQHYRTKSFPLWKLAVNVVTFATFYLFYVIWCIFLFLNTDRCLVLRNIVEMVHILAFIRLSIILRICIDPVVSFVADQNIRNALLALLGMQGMIEVSSSRENSQATGFAATRTVKAGNGTLSDVTPERDVPNLSITPLSKSNSCPSPQKRNASINKQDDMRVPTLRNVVDP